MTVLTIKNLRLTPYQQKDAIKAVWGDTLTLTFTIPHVAGESYVCGMDNERVVYPPSRPVCAYTNVFTRDGDNVTFSLPLNTSKFRSYVSTIRKPMPVWLQVCRVGIDGKCETLVLDDILAIPSVLDATNTVCPGDPLKQLLENKMDKPAAAGAEGQVLTMDADGHYAWADLPKMDQEQADWDESDSTAYSYIKHKPAISEVGHTGEYNDILNRPDLKTVATTGSYNDLTDKPAIPAAQVQADYGQSDSGAVDYIKHKPDLSVYSLVTETGNSISMSIDADYDLVVSLLDKAGNTLSTQDIDLPIESMIVDATYAAGVLTLTLQNGNTVDVDISDIVSGLVPDSRKVNGHALSADVTISYNDLTDKPVIPDQVQSDWDQSDSQAVDYIKNKPVIPEQVQSDWDESDSDAASYIRNKPEITGGADDADYLCITFLEDNCSVRIRPNGTPPAINIEFSLDKSNWTSYSNVTESLTFDITGAKAGDKVWIRGNNNTFSNGNARYWRLFAFTLDESTTVLKKFNISGNIMSIIDKSCKSLYFNNYERIFSELFYYTKVVDASELKLPVLSLSKNCYNRLFEGCSELLYPPQLPANVLAQQCYYEMFKGCTSLVEAPALPATTLANYCYSGMFSGCTALVKAPDLPATTLVQNCYASMFSGCTSLKHVKVGATALSETGGWFTNAAATGVFECPSALDTTIRDASHVPAGWIVKYTDDPQSDWDESDSLVSTYIQNKPDISGDISTAIADALTFHNN